MLEINDLNAFYSDFQALFDVDLELSAGKTLALVGANGAGKTSLLHSICGMVHSKGSIQLSQTDLNSLPVQGRAAQGVAMAPEGRRMFVSLSVKENLLMGANIGRAGHWNFDTVTELFPILREFANRPASLLSGGQQQMVAIGRALMANPALLLLDEVSLGLAPVVAEELMQALNSIRDESEMMTILVEQDIGRAVAASDHFICLLEGRVALRGSCENADFAAIGRAYFGENTA